MYGYVRLVLILYASVVSSATYSEIETGPSEQRCKTAVQLAEVGVASEYSILGDCFYLGVYEERDVKQAKFFYLQGYINGQDYGGLKLGGVLLFESTNKFDKALGFYFLKQLSKIENSKYVGYANYYLAIFYADKDKYETAKDLLSVAIDHGLLDAYFAKAYLEVSVEKNYKKTNHLLHSATELQQNLGITETEILSFSCWIDDQKNRKIMFPIIKEKVSDLYKIYGTCGRW